VPAVTLFPLFNLAAAKWPVSPWWPQQLTNGLVVWALGNTSIALVVMASFGYRRISLDSLGIWPLGFRISDVLRAANTALWTVGFAYLLLLAVDAIFKVDFRFWVIAFKPVADWHFGPYVRYLPLLVIFFVVLGASLREFSMRGTTTQACLCCGLILTGGFVVLLAAQYV